MSVAAPSTDPPLRRGRIGRSGSRVGLILPYGVTANMEPGGPLWESLVAAAPARPQVYGLVVPWGIVHERTLYASPAFLAHGGLGISEKDAAAHAVVALRAWLDTYGPAHQQLAAVIGGPFTPIWNRAVTGSLMAPKIKLFPLPTRGGGRPWGPIRKRLSSFMGKSMRTPS